jgi:hypothetical protein
MFRTISVPDPGGARLFTKETLIKGQPAEIECVQILGQTYSVRRAPVRLLALEDEWYEDVHDPMAVVKYLQEHREIRTDVFTFCQRLPHLEPKYRFRTEPESLAVLTVDSFDTWWTKQITKNTRNMVRKSQKSGVDVRECMYDDPFVRGMTEIFNESPVRQGRPFWHYGKDFETIKRQFSRFIHRELLIGAYFEGSLVGFAMLGNAGTFCDLGQIIAMAKHRDKAIPNALIAKAVEICERLKWRHLVYGYWTEDSLAAFKRHSGFYEARMPRYFVPLSVRGRAGLLLGAHKGWKSIVPAALTGRLKQLRASWYAHS